MKLSNKSINRSRNSIQAKRGQNGNVRLIVGRSYGNAFITYPTETEAKPTTDNLTKENDDVASVFESGNNVSTGGTSSRTGSLTDITPKNDTKDSLGVNANMILGLERTLQGATVAALTIYDMVKAVSHRIRIETTELVTKTGGKRTIV